MIRRSERIMSQAVGGVTTRYRITRIHVFGCCVWVNTVQLAATPATGPLDDSTGEFPVTGGAKP